MRKILKNRLFIAFTAILMSAILIFSGIKLTESQNETITVVQAISNIRKGVIIDETMVTTTTIGAYNISSDYTKNPSEVVGKYALADFYPNDFIQAPKVADTLPSAEEKLLKLDGTRLAISINLHDFSRGLSDKIITGDIVSCLVTQEAGTEIPQELTYVEVLTTTMPSGVDKEHSGDEADENLATATLLVSPHQAKLLSEYDKKAEIHLALVYRGDEKIAKEFLDKQTETLDMLITPPTEPTQSDSMQEAA